MSTESQTVTIDPALVTLEAAETCEQRSHANSDWGEVNRELLAIRLRKAYSAVRHQDWYAARVNAQPIDDEWLAVANEAIAALLETP